MRRLVVMRHAKSSWKDGNLSDHQRPLNKRGRRDAPRIAECLLGLDWVPDLVVSSDSQRTRETWAQMATVFQNPIPTLFSERLYHGGMGAARELLAEQSAKHRCIIILGHNPGWEQVVYCLSGEAVTMTTANAALLVGKGATWDEALGVRGSWDLKQVLRPKEL
jgi:phosphohistidine phosphatase